MKKISIFQLATLGVFGVAMIIGVLVFGGIINTGGSSGSSATPSGSVALWGTLDSNSLKGAIDVFNREGKVTINYTQKDPSTFDSELVEAIANGKAPDMVILPDSLIWRYSNKLAHIPFANVPLATFQSTYVDGSSIFLDNSGVVAMPFIVDPLVLYYNKDIFNQKGVTTLPHTWDDFSNDVRSLTEKSADLTVTLSGGALGSYDNISHAEDIISLLLLQAGNPITKRTDKALASTISDPSDASRLKLAESALQFYTSFANPVKDVYTWNPGLAKDHDAFLSGNLAMYFGLASEISDLQTTNPNLNFGVLPVPVPASTVGQATTAEFYGIAITKDTQNRTGAYYAATSMAGLSDQTFLQNLHNNFLTPPVRRDMLTPDPSKSYESVFDSAALVAKTWLKPNPTGVGDVFKGLIHDLVSNPDSYADIAVNTASAKLDALGGN